MPWGGLEEGLDLPPASSRPGAEPGPPAPANLKGYVHLPSLPTEDAGTLAGQGQEEKADARLTTKAWLPGSSQALGGTELPVLGRLGDNSARIAEDGCLLTGSGRRGPTAVQATLSSPTSVPTSSSLTHCMESWLQCTHRALRRMVSRSNSCSWKAWQRGRGGNEEGAAGCGPLTAQQRLLSCLKGSQPCGLQPHLRGRAGAVDSRLSY
jgi:hypothetical protein